VSGRNQNLKDLKWNSLIF